MLKAGLIGAGIGFIYISSLYLLAPLCTLCLTPFLGVGVGYLTAWFDKPTSIEAGIPRSLGAGLMTASSVMVGQVIAALVKGILIINWSWARTIVDEMGWPDAVITEYWQNAIIGDSFCGIFNLTIIIGSALIGNMFWFRRQTVNKAVPEK
ncbi:hypothetical protein QUF64_11880 [Anaerolineales bacterium HSG6]|nr:hypothetical protein [Anaerolineales bacterium HSG6]MDM8532143.1 hypothetical protein [Anaerolineales bacterium HSG25]